MQSVGENARTTCRWVGAIPVGLLLPMFLTPCGAAMRDSSPDAARNETSTRSLEKRVGMPARTADADPHKVAAIKKFGAVVHSIDWATATDATVRLVMKKSMTVHGWAFEYITPHLAADNPLHGRMYSQIPQRDCLNATSIAAGMGLPSGVEVLGLHEIWRERRPEVVAEMVQRNSDSPSISRVVYSLVGQPAYELIIFGGRNCFYKFNVFKVQ